MEQKLVRVPFDIELAKKITNKEIEGRIVTCDGKNARVVCWDKKSDSIYYIVALLDESIMERILTYTINGSEVAGEERYNDLMLEIPEYLTFRDGDVIYCEVDNGGGDYCKWISILEGDVDTTLSLNFNAYVTLITDASKYAGELLFDDYSDNIDLIRLATEAEKQKLIETLKASKNPEAVEYLDKYFGIKDPSKISNSEKTGKILQLRDDQADKATDDYMNNRNLSGPQGSFRKGFCSGWNACLKHLAGIPWGEAMNEIVNYCKEKEE